MFGCNLAAIAIKVVCKRYGYNALGNEVKSFDESKAANMNSYLCAAKNGFAIWAFEKVVFTIQAFSKPHIVAE